MTDIPSVRGLGRAARQEQFLEVLSREEAEDRFRRHLRLAPLGKQTVSLAQALGRVLASDVAAGVDVPGFDRASVDGFAIRAEDTAGAAEGTPTVLEVNGEVLTPGVEPRVAVVAGAASVIATGGVVPRGADAVVMVEQTELREEQGAPMRVEVRRPAFAGQFIAAAGSDVSRGETVLRGGQRLTSREIGMLAALGLDRVEVWRRPRVAIFSTGDELVPQGRPLRAGQIYDSNGPLLAAAIEELGGHPVLLGIVPDDAAALGATLARALAENDAVLLSGGTSKGAGDLAYAVVAELKRPGVVVHGVALKPGKPLCLAVSDGKPVAVLPGFPTSAIFTFHAFVAPVISAFAGQPPARHQTVRAMLPTRIDSERGRTEYVLVSLVRGEGDAIAAYPVGKGSGAVSGFAQADGFFAVPALTEVVAAGTPVEVQLIGAGLELPDLVVIGSHCVGLDFLVGELNREGVRVKSLSVGSMGGLAAANRGECDVAGIHLMDPESGVYNAPYMNEALSLLPGYTRLQGVVFRPDDGRFEAFTTAEQAIGAAAADPELLMVNRNVGSGTRILVDRALGGARPNGYNYATRSHNAVAVAVAQRRADWGVTIRTVARQYGLAFLPLQPERYDFVVPKARRDRHAVRRFLALLERPDLRRALGELGFEAIGDPPADTRA